MTERPAPLVPAHVDLTWVEWMPFYGEKLQRSDHNAVGDAAYRASINLWWAAWRNIPAASLPSDDLSLQKAADLVRDPRTWRQVKAHALRNFVLCSDGRLYHTFLAPIAIATWQSRIAQSVKGSAGAAARWKGHEKKPPPSKSPARAVDNRGTGIKTGCNGHSDSIAQAHENDGTATKNDGDVQILSSNIGVDTNVVARARDGEPHSENSKSKQEADANSRASPGVPEHLRKYLPSSLRNLER